MNIKEIIISGLVLFIIDTIYLQSHISFFRKFINTIQKKKFIPNKIAFVLCYILLIFGINYLVISRKESILFSFICGLIIYGVYEFTNYALFSDWTFYMVITDMLWGGILFSLTTQFTYLILKYKVN